MEKRVIKKICLLINIYSIVELVIVVVVVVVDGCG